MKSRLLTISVVVALTVFAIDTIVQPAAANRSPAGAPHSAKKKCKKKKSRRPCRGKAPAQTPPVGLSAHIDLPVPQVSLASTPALFPDFDPSVSDYVIRCTGDPVTVSGDAVDGSQAVIDGQGPFSGHFQATVPLSANQAFSMRAGNARTDRTYNFRCLPPDFPEWDFDLLGEPAQDFYVVTPTRRTATGAGHYVVVFDRHGTPVWWYDAPVSLADAKVLSDGNLAWGRGDLSGYEIRRLDGTIAKTLSFVGSPTNDHDMQEVGNGNYLVMSYKTRATTEDLTPIGGTTDQTVQDADVQEIDPDGNVVWEWNSHDAGIDLDEIPAHWWASVVSSKDLVHINSIQLDGDSLIVSLRKTDAIYSINRLTGQIEWKLGGTTTPESLTLVNDPYPALPFAGQHDARILPDGTLTLHDNATAADRPPRAVRYAIDPIARTATFLEGVADPEVDNAAACCGGARRSPSGSWLISWGANSQVTEFSADGNRTFRLDFGPLSTGPFSYRAFPVPAGLLQLGDLRAGMNIMFPR